MGYCHYWGRPKTIPADVFGTIGGEVRSVIAAVAPALGLFGGIKVRGALGSGRPIIDAEHICFNGSPRKETFWISSDVASKSPDQEPGEHGLYWDFVKTGQLPYDTVVVAALVSLKVRLPEARLSSDGGAEEWAAGLELYRRATGRAVTFESLTNLPPPSPPSAVV